MDSFVICIIFFLSLFARAWNLGFPPDIIFDEVYFADFSNYYINRTYYHDIHPPLGKMVMALIASLTQYQGNINISVGLGHQYKVDELNFVSLRLTPIIFSSFCPLFIYCAMRSLSFSITASLTAAIGVVFDITSIVEGKFILSDAMLHFFSTLHIYCFANFLKNPSFFNNLVAGITMGCAFSCKYTALGLLALDGITQIIWLFTCPSLEEIFQRATLLLIPAISVLIGSWMIHYTLADYNSRYSGFASANFKKSLCDKGTDCYYGNKIAWQSLLYETILENIRGQSGNMRITSIHPWSSMPQYWALLMDKYVLFYSRSPSRLVVSHGNPMSYWLSALSIALSVLSVPFGRVDWRVLMFILGWICCYLPFLAVPRAMFLYHYIVPLFFACMTLGGFLDVVTESPIKYTIMSIVIGVIFFCYCFFWPMIYGTPCPDCHATRQWLRRWTQGPPWPLNYFGKDLFNTTVKKATFPNR